MVEKSARIPSGGPESRHFEPNLRQKPWRWPNRPIAPAQACVIRIVQCPRPMLEAEGADEC